MASSGYSDVKRSLPGWSLARDAPREKKKQGWECPAPTVQDWEDYKQWKEEQEKKDELPTAPQMFFADASLLYYKDPDVQLPWIHRVRCELPRRVGRLSGDLPVKASYIGCAAADGGASGFESFKKAVAEIGIVLCRHIHQPPSRFELAHLEQSDLILLDGGDRKKLWETLGTDVGSSAVAEHVKWRYLQGAVVIAIGEAMSLLGTKSWYYTGEKKSLIPYTGWKIFPHIVAPERDDEDLEDAVEALGGAGIVILGIHNGGGMIFNKDGLVEPVRHMMQEYRWDWQSESVKQALLIGPPRGTGLICPLYAALGQGEGAEDDEFVDAYSYALTQEEEQDEESLCEKFDEHASWLTTEAKSAAEEEKKAGNDAFKAGDADRARLYYDKARILVKDGATPWSQLPEDFRRKLEALGGAAAAASAGGAAADGEKLPGQKEDYRSTSILLTLLMNLSACHLLLYDQDEDRKKKREQGQPEGKSPASPQAGDAASTDMPLVEVRDNLVAAFRAANDALALCGGRAAKAWFRRGCVFEKMRDPKNAIRDFEEALVRAPGDKVISQRRDVLREAAGSVAENMYYARHKELDAQELLLKMAERRALLLRGQASDPHAAERKEFSVLKQLAVAVDGTLEEVDGKPTLRESESGGSKTEGPYLHPQALWTWEFLVQRAPKLQLLGIENVDIGSGPLEWLCKGLRTHSEIKVLKFSGVHLGAAGAKMLRNVVAQNSSLIELNLDSCALHDAGLDEISEGLRSNTGPLETLSLRHNYFSNKKLARLAAALCEEDNSISLTELDLSENALGTLGAKEVARIIGSAAHQLRVLRLEDAAIDLSGFWRLVGKLSDARPLTRLDLRRNPIGRGTRRIWRGTMGPTIRCEVVLSDHPLKHRREAQMKQEEQDTRDFPMPDLWV
eukprot:TRINITY_DN24905_c0_g1_i1.p1 TRINITY_DN24905_c0_g1~~TRINITY_DN24905_c0_g1_i1.p1  ORF type:complete len:905 (-),score=263.12 TRINITY_DN24905_c0_g1_i1:205-2919(-)